MNTLPQEYHNDTNCLSGLECILLLSDLNATDQWLWYKSNIISIVSGNILGTKQFSVENIKIIYFKGANWLVLTKTRKNQVCAYINPFLRFGLVFSLQIALISRESTQFSSLILDLLTGKESGHKLRPNTKSTLSERRISTIFHSFSM